MLVVSLRPVCDTDLDTLFEQTCDPEANHMAGFVGEDPTDRAAFDRRWDAIRANPNWSARTIVVDGEDGEAHIAGSIAVWSMDGPPTNGAPEVTYWIGRSFWGHGIATRALELFLADFTQRPVMGRAAMDNLASIRVLKKCGFKLVCEERGYANARGKEIEEVVMQLG